jgi:1-acyl-sn-glycerol-3-phosphate acyltransferase
VEPAFRLAELVGLPPFKLWFNWSLDGLERIPREGPVLVAANHISYIDPVAHAYFLFERGRRARFLAKSELFDIPVFGALMRNARQIPVHRESGDADALVHARDALERGEAVVVYPEGTVTRDPSFLPMRSRTGIVRLSLSTGVPITPVAVWGAQHVWQKSGPGSLAFGRPIWVASGEEIHLDVHGAREVDGDRLRELTDLVTERLRRLVVDMRARYPARWS